MISRIRFLLGGSATVVALATAMVPPRTNMARGLTLHRIVGAICIQESTDFCALSGGGVPNLNWLCVR